MSTGKKEIKNEKKELNRDKKRCDKVEQQETERTTQEKIISECAHTKKQWIFLLHQNNQNLPQRSNPPTNAEHFLGKSRAAKTMKEDDEQDGAS